MTELIDRAEVLKIVDNFAEWIKREKRLRDFVSDKYEHYIHKKHLRREVKFMIEEIKKIQSPEITEIPYAPYQSANGVRIEPVESKDTNTQSQGRENRQRIRESRSPNNTQNPKGCGQFDIIYDEDGEIINELKCREPCLKCQGKVK